MARSKDPPADIRPAPVEVIDLTGDVPDSQNVESSTPDNSAPIRQGEQISSLVYSASLHLIRDVVTPELRRIVIIDDDDSTPRASSPPSVINRQAHSFSPMPPPPVETRLLPQIFKEEMMEPVIPAPVAAKKRPLHSKLQAKRFKANSRKGRRQVANFVNLHLPFGYEPLPKVNLGTLGDALRKLGVNI